VNYLAKKTLLVTGAAGFIGSNFCTLISETRPDCRLVMLDALTYAGNIANIQHLIDGDKAIFVQADIRDQERMDAIFREFDVEAVAHLAAESHVDRSILGPRAFVESNVNGTLNLLTAARQHWPEKMADEEPGRNRFLHVSTDEVFGTLTPTDPPFNEETPYAPTSPYSASKAASDHLVRAWHHTYGFPSLVTHCSNNYGPWQFPEKLIPLMILNASEGKTLPVYGDGMQIRDWLHVADHCKALLLVLEQGRDGESYCVGGGNDQSNIHIVEMLCDHVDKRLGNAQGHSRELIRHVVDRPGHDRRYSINFGKLNRELGWAPKFEFESSLGDVVDWYLDHGVWIDGIRSGAYLKYYDQQYGARLSGAKLGTTS
jgi:dTDP-glucose 4,6-dehydratase